MNITTKIVRRVNVVLANYISAIEYELTVFSCPVDGGECGAVNCLTDLGSDLKKTPVSVLISGYGVICKAFTEGDATALQVTSQPEKFQWNYSNDNGKILFVRHEQTDVLMEYLESVGVKIVAVRCFDAKGAQQQAVVKGNVEELASNVLTLRGALRFTPEGSAVAQTLFHRIKVPVLGMVLLLLIANIFFSKNVGGRYAQQRQEIAAIERNIVKQNDSSKNRLQVITEFNRRLPWHYAFVCDQIGGVVPDNIFLTRLAIQPLQKSVEVGRSPQLSERTIVIQGEADGPADISGFVSVLGGLELSGEVRLVSVDRDRDRGKPLFHIELKL